MPTELLIFTVVAAACFGAAVGSFLNVCIYRLPRDGLGVGTPPRSFCPSCGDPIAWYDNLPILSWMALGGRCRSCREPIAIRYLLVEALTAALFAVVVHRYAGAIAEGTGTWGGCLAILGLVSGLLVAGFIDADLRLIPDEISVGGMYLLPPLVFFFPDLHTRVPNGLVIDGLAVVAAALREPSAMLPDALREGLPFAALVAGSVIAGFAAGSALYRLYRRKRLPDAPNRLRDYGLAGVLAGAALGLVTAQVLSPELSLTPRVYALWAMLLGMGAGSGLVFVVGVVASWAFRKPAMGFGDVKLMGLLGGFAGWDGALIGFFIACLLGSLVGVVRLAIYRDRYLPFGPFLSIGCVFLILWPEAFHAALDWYLGFFQP